MDHLTTALQNLIAEEWPDQVIKLFSLPDWDDADHRNAALKSTAGVFFTTDFVGSTSADTLLLAALEDVDWIVVGQFIDGLILGMMEDKPLGDMGVIQVIRSECLIIVGSELTGDSEFDDLWLEPISPPDTDEPVDVDQWNLDQL